MKSLVKKFLKENKISNIIDGDICVPQGSNQEVVTFIKYDREEQLWNYGRIERGKEEVQVVFQEKEKALLYSIYDDYKIDLSIKLRRDYSDDFRNIDDGNKEEQINFIEKNIDESYLNKLKINDNQSLIYLDKYIIPKQGLFSEVSIIKFYFNKIFSVMAYDQTVKDLIDFGFDKKELDKYFKFEEFEVISL